MSEATQARFVDDAPAATTYQVRAYAASSANSGLAPATIRRRVTGPRDVQIDVLLCGVCHSDLHQVRNEWAKTMPTVYPVVPGHEIVGRVSKAGGAVRKFKEGDLAAVGCMVDSCRTCAACREGQEQFCEGARVVVFTTSPDKVEDAVRLGAHDVVVSTNAADMQQQLSSFDFILDTVSAVHDLNAYLDLLKRDGTLTLVGAPETPLPVGMFSLLLGRRRLAGSIIGGLRETQEMLDFCAGHGIAADVEVIPIQKINEAYDRLATGDVKYRFVPRRPRQTPPPVVGSSSPT
jgi:D-arabinose 1-dehydrogenase-like Zn-dependent alcohol dehydrogenase